MDVKKYAVVQEVSGDVIRQGPPGLVSELRLSMVSRLHRDIFQAGLFPGSLKWTEERLVWDHRELGGRREARPSENADLLRIALECRALPVDPVAEMAALLGQATCNSMRPEDRALWALKRERLLGALS